MEHVMIQRRIRVILLVTVVTLLAALAPVAVFAQDSSSDDGFLLRVNGPVTISGQEVVDNVIVIGDNATVDGTITGTLVVVNGDATITGTVQEDITVVRGTLELTSTANVEDITVIRGTLVQESGAVVAGSITEGDFQVSFWDWSVFWAFLWAGFTLVILTAGVIFAGIGGRQLKRSGDTIVNAPGAMLLGVAAAWIVLPLLMFPVLITIVGAPLALGYFLFVLPILWFLGYIVAGVQLGRFILRSRADDPHPYLPALVGLVLLQLIGILPVFGGLIGFLAGVVGSGALLAVAWHAWRGPGQPVATPDAAVTAPEPVH
jgi:hypothetical protein